MRGGVLALVALLLLICPRFALGEGEEDVSIQDGVSAWMEAVDWTALEGLLASLPEEVRGVWNGFSVKDKAAELALGTGGGLGSLPEVLKALLKTEGRRLAGLAATLTGLAMTGALCGALAGEGKGGAGDAAAFICRCFTLTVVLSAFAAGAEAATACMNSLCKSMELAAPVLLTLLTGLGAVSTAGLFQPAAVLLTGGVAGAMRSVVVPLTLCGGVVSLFDQLSDRVRLSQMASGVRGGVKWAMGAVSVVYAGVAALCGVNAAARDSVAIRTAKYAAGSVLPQVSGLVNGSFDTVAGCAGLVKNAAGTVMIALTVLAVLTPLARLLAGVILLRLTAAVTEPLAEKRQTGMLRAGADMLEVLLSSTAAVTGMFLVTLGLTVGLGNAGFAG